MTQHVVVIRYNIDTDNDTGMAELNVSVVNGSMVWLQLRVFVAPLHHFLSFLYWCYLIKAENVFFKWLMDCKVGKNRVMIRVNASLIDFWINFYNQEYLILSYLYLIIFSLCYVLITFMLKHKVTFGFK